MKVLIINSSPHDNECTAYALKVVENELNNEGIETITLNIGSMNIRGCLDCNFCKENKRCVIDDVVNKASSIFAESDGILIGTPVYYGSSNGSLISFLDRLFHSSYIGKTMKVGACVVSSRRAGSTSTIDEVYKYFQLSGMPIVSSTYFNEVHGFTKEDVMKDKEGLQTMRNLGRNMAFLIKSIALGKEKYGLPKKDRGEWTHFINK